jgi:hypothetical protein
LNTIIVRQDKKDALKDLRNTYPMTLQSLRGTNQVADNKGAFLYSVDTFSNYESAFPRFTGDKPEERNEFDWYYLLFDKYVLAKEHWSFQTILNITYMCMRVFGNQREWVKTFTAEIKKKKYMFSCSYCLALCRLLIPPTYLSQPSQTSDLNLNLKWDVTAWSIEKATTHVPKKGDPKRERGQSEASFSRCSSKQTPLVNALFSPMGYKAFRDGRPQLCPSTSPTFNHREQDRAKTSKILDTIQAKDPPYNLINGAYYFCDFVIREESNSENQAGKPKAKKFPSLVDYSEVGGKPLSGTPVATPTSDRQKSEAQYLLDLLKRDASKGHKHHIYKLGPEADEVQAITGLNVSTMFVACKLEVDSFFGENAQNQVTFTAMLSDLQQFIKNKASSMADFFPHIPEWSDTSPDEELPLIFHQTRFLLQSILTIRNGTLEGFHRMHAAVSALTNYPHTAVTHKNYPLDPTPKFINTKLFLQRAECFQVVPYYQTQGRALFHYSRQVSENDMANLLNLGVNFKIGEQVVRGFPNREIQNR